MIRSTMKRTVFSESREEDGNMRKPELRGHWGVSESLFLCSGRRSGGGSVKRLMSVQLSWNPCASAGRSQLKVYCGPSRVRGRKKVCREDRVQQKERGCLRQEKGKASKGILEGGKKLENVHCLEKRWRKL